MIRLFSSSLNFLVRALVIGPNGTWYLACDALLVVFSSFPLSSKGFALKSLSASKGVTLNVALTLYSPRRSNLQALSLILFTTWNGPSPRGSSFDFLCYGKRSLCICNQTKSLGSKMTFLRHLLACRAYCSVLLSMLSLAVAWIFLTSSTFFSPSKFICSIIGMGDKSNGVNGLKP